MERAPRTTVVEGLAMLALGVPCLGFVVRPMSSASMEGSAGMLCTAIGAAIGVFAFAIARSRASRVLAVIVTAVNLVCLGFDYDEWADGDRADRTGATLDHLDELRWALCEDRPLPDTLSDLAPRLPRRLEQTGLADGWDRRFVYTRDGAIARVELDPATAAILPGAKPLVVPRDCHPEPAAPAETTPAP